MMVADGSIAGQAIAAANDRSVGAGGFGRLLRQRRRAAGLTQEELAERCGISVRAIADAESGRTRRPHRRSVQLIAAALHLAGAERSVFCAAARGATVERDRIDAWPGGLRQDSQPDIARPRQLPAAVPDFTGRAAELEALTENLGNASAYAPGTVVISAIAGTAGVGKTALALHWAHQVAERFGDGQLYVNLRGFDLSGIPATPAEAIRRFLDALAVPPERVPTRPDAQASMYRSLLADRRMLMVLDNARDEQQVRPLLPASPGSLVIITSRNLLTGLAASYGAQLLTLDVPTHAEAVQLLTARLGHRATEDSAVVGEIAMLCARLPLALAVTAARAVARPSCPLASLAAELRDSASCLDALDSGDPAASVRVALSCSYRQLSAQAARLFRRLGMHPGPDISVPAAATLAGIAERRARVLLRELTRESLVAEHLPGRYALHDLLRVYAAEQALTHDSGTAAR